jgi:hypothetical protein
MVLAPFDKLRVSGKYQRNHGGDPLMLSLSKHGAGFFSSLLRVMVVTETSRFRVHGRANGFIEGSNLRGGNR